MGWKDRRWAGVTVCLAAAGCGGHSGLSQSAPRGLEARHLTAAQRCEEAARLTPRASFAGWHVGAVHFFSATSGVGITAGRFPCFRRVRAGEQEVGFPRQAVRLASTSDGGRTWFIVGMAIPVAVGPGGAIAEQIAATSPADVWAAVGPHRLVATNDGGSHWQVQAIPTPVVQLAASGGFVWALTCPQAARRTAPAGCRPQLWRTNSAATPWTRVTLPPATALDQSLVQFAAAGSDLIIELLEASKRPTGQLLVSHDAGKRWTEQRAPTWDHQQCDNPAGLTAARPHTFWLLCLGGAAAGSSTKGLLRSTNAGHTWTTVSAVTSLTQLPRRGSITRGEPSALAAGSQTRLWLSFTNGLTESNDAGRRWTDVPQAFNSEGWETTIDALSARHAWVLAPGAGLWRTTDGLHWHPLRPLNTG
jgi:photosystem II stability/assembly factor-like uncharacterized protein